MPKWLMITEIINKQSSSRYLMWTFGENVDSVQFSCSVVSNFVTPWTAAHQASLYITSSRSLFKLMSIELVTPPNHLILCRPLLLLPSIFPSIRDLSNESVLRIMWPKYWSFGFSISPANEYSGISPANEYSGLISFRIDWFDLLEVQGTLKSPLDCKEIQPVLPKGDQS